MNTILAFFIGIIGLSIIVFVHECGHYIVARLMGVHVDILSLGWGKPIFNYAHNGTCYIVGIIPFGGYCKLRGQTTFYDANSIQDKYSFYGVKPWRRILICAGGSFFNILLALFIYMGIYGIGYTYDSYSNCIVLSTVLEDNTVNSRDHNFKTRLNPAAYNGLQNGDCIVTIDGVPQRNFRNVQESLLEYKSRIMHIGVIRNNKRVYIELEPRNRNGINFIGVAPFIAPVIVASSYALQLLGLKPGVRIVQIDGYDIISAQMINKVLNNYAYLYNNVSTGVFVTYEVDGRQFTIRMPLHYKKTESGRTLIMPQWTFEGVQWYSTPLYNFGELLYNGVQEIKKITYFIGLSLLHMFKNEQNIEQIIVGPLESSLYIGQQTMNTMYGTVLGYKHFIKEQFRRFFTFILFMSISLSISTLLPIPILDGGRILLYIGEWFYGCMPRFFMLQAYFFVGFILLMIFIFKVLNSDIKYIFYNFFS